MFLRIREAESEAMQRAWSNRMFELESIKSCVNLNRIPAKCDPALRTSRISKIIERTCKNKLDCSIRTDSWFRDIKWKHLGSKSQLRSTIGADNRTLRMWHFTSKFYITNLREWYSTKSLTKWSTRFWSFWMRIWTAMILRTFWRARISCFACSRRSCEPCSKRTYFWTKSRINTYLLISIKSLQT